MSGPDAGDHCADRMSDSSEVVEWNAGHLTSFLATGRTESLHKDRHRGCVQIVFFFFSSRRRHTRFDCDWSSDVCSSDLSARRVADSNRTGRTPVASGSNVPAWPTRCAPVSRRRRLTTEKEVSPALLSTLRTPVAKREASGLR